MYKKAETIFRSHLDRLKLWVNTYKRLCYAVVLVCGKNVSPHFFNLFWRCLAISTKDLLINDDIKLAQVRVVGDDGEVFGIMSADEAREIAYDRGLDLVLIAPTANPPVCKVIDYGKYRFDRDKREKEAKKKQQNTEVKEIQLSLTIDTHDFMTKVKHAHRFLKGMDKVKVVVRFRGRQITHQSMGYDILQRFADACAEYGACDKPPVAEGRNITMMLSPIKPDAKNKG